MSNVIEIKVFELNSGYGKKTVLQDVSFAIRKGSFVGLIGPNGSGKSTLIKTIIKYLPPKSGEVELGGSDVSKLTTKDIARRVAVVPQRLETKISLTAWELVMLGRYPHLSRFQHETKEDETIVKEAMEATNTRYLAERTISEMSGGEYQRVLIAQALAQSPEILLLDEPTSHLDINHQIELCELLFRLNKNHGLTIITVLHDINLASRYCEEVVLLKEGRIFIAGATSEVLKVDILEEVYGTKVHREIDLLTGKPYFTYYSKEKEYPGNDLLLFGDKDSVVNNAAYHVHLIAGGGSAVDLFPILSSLNYRLSTGVLNINDTDWRKAKKMGITIVEEAPFNPISDQNQALNTALAKAADLIILCNIPFGSGNIKNLLTAEETHNSGKPVLICNFAPISKRDFTGGDAEVIYNKLLNDGAYNLSTKNELIILVRKLTSRAAQK